MLAVPKVRVGEDPRGERCSIAVEKDGVAECPACRGRHARGETWDGDHCLCRTHTVDVVSDARDYRRCNKSSCTGKN